MNAVDFAGLGIPSQKMERQRSAQIAIQSAENVQLHLAEFGGGIGVVRDVDEIVDLRSVDLFVLKWGGWIGDQDSRLHYRLGLDLRLARMHPTEWWAKTVLAA